VDAPRLDPPRRAGRGHRRITGGGVAAEPTRKDTRIKVPFLTCAVDQRLWCTLMSTRNVRLRPGVESVEMVNALSESTIRQWCRPVLPVGFTGSRRIVRRCAAASSRMKSLRWISCSRRCGLRLTVICETARRIACIACLACGQSIRCTTARSSIGSWSGCEFGSDGIVVLAASGYRQHQGLTALDCYGRN
jgi:hypothetical protein